MDPEEPFVIFRRVPDSSGIDRERIQQFATTVSRRLAHGNMFSCRVTGDVELRGLNHRYLGHNYPTDVLSFPSTGIGDGYLGDLAISRQRAAAQAAEHGHGVNEEIEILILHGLLHLLGLDHERDSGSMARKELLWRKKLGLPMGLIERVPK